MTHGILLLLHIDSMSFVKESFRGMSQFIVTALCRKPRPIILTLRTCLSVFESGAEYNFFYGIYEAMSVFQVWFYIIAFGPFIPSFKKQQFVLVLLV